MRTNEFGEEVSEETLEEFISRVRKLEDDEIDKLWFEIGFVIRDRNDDMKALRRKDIENIRKDMDSAKTVVWNLLSETPLERFRQELQKIEES